jgi:nicotinamide phosphoribosyltransferase
LLRAIWYPTTVATNSYESKKLILAALEKTGDPTLIDFKLHDFGARGVSSLESAGLGGAAHLINFMGTDTVTALLAAREYYGADIAGFSIPAMEHSTVTSWGRDLEVESYRNMLKTYGKPGALLACVSDSYDIYNACKLWGTELKDEVIASGATVVIRPDSGEPSEVVVKCMYILEKYFGSVTNAKGFRVLNNVRVIQGDGIDHASIRSILFCMEMAGFSADNIAFGQGGALLQQVNRDTMAFAMKCSAVGIRQFVQDTSELADEGSGEMKVVWRDVFKDPVTDHGKVSKKGRVQLWQCGNEYESAVTQPTRWVDNGFQWEPALLTVFRNGEIKHEITFDEVRANARK